MLKCATNIMHIDAGVVKMWVIERSGTAFFVQSVVRHTKE